MDAFSSILLNLSPASFFSYVFLPYHGMFLFFVLFCLPSSHLLFSASRTWSFFLCHSHPALPRHSFVCCFFRGSCFLGGYMLYSRTLYVSTWPAYLDFFATLDLLCLTVCIHIIRISPGWRVRKDTGGAADVVGLQEQFNEKNTTSLVGSPLPAHACVPTVFQRDSRTH